jgi:hypothetical protein
LFLGMLVLGYWRLHASTRKGWCLEMQVQGAGTAVKRIPLGGLLQPTKACPCCKGRQRGERSILPQILPRAKSPALARMHPPASTNQPGSSCCLWRQGNLARWGARLGATVELCSVQGVCSVKLVLGRRFHCRSQWERARWCCSCEHNKLLLALCELCVGRCGAFPGASLPM